MAALRCDLAGHRGAAVAELGDQTLIDQITALEELKAAACATQARLTVAFDESVRRAAAARGVAAAAQGHSIAAQIGLARRESPAKASRLLGLAKTLVNEMPATLDALASGKTNEWRATLMARETATLDLADRKAVDADLGPRLAELGDRTTGDAARKLAYQLDPAQLVRRQARAESDRTVSIRPAPDCMSFVTALLPVAQGVAVHAALVKQTETLRAAGDTRSTGQLKADTLVARVTGTGEEASTPAEPDVSVSLVLSDSTLLGGDHTPAHLAGFGPIPAFLARQIVDRATNAWLRRLYTTCDGDLVAADSRTRFFPKAVREALVARDQWCRTPWCGAPIRHADHITRHADGGLSSITNGQGLCARCNETKETHGWRTQLAPGRRHRVVTTTPTGHTHTSTAIPLPRGPDGLSRGEHYLTELILEYSG